MTEPVEIDFGGPDRFSTALAFAALAHQGQTYGHRQHKVGPYIYHPIRVAQRVYEEHQKVVAVLHDVLEDTDKDPREYDFLTIVEEAALELLTRGGESYDQYITRMVEDNTPAGEIAREVKRADLLENLSRNPKAHHRVRYGQALATLGKEEWE